MKKYQQIDNTSSQANLPAGDGEAEFVSVSSEGEWKQGDIFIDFTRCLKMSCDSISSNNTKIID